MPITYRFEPDERLLVIVGEGDNTQAERLDAMRSWLRDPAYERGMNTLCDFSASTSIPTLTELQELVAFIRRHAETIGPKKMAMVTGRPLMFGVARQFQALAESGPLRVNVFTSTGEALTWLRETNDVT